MTSYWFSTINYAMLCWQRMLLNISDLIVLSLVGLIGLKLGVAVLLVTASVNVGIMSYTQAAIVHNLKDAKALFRIKSIVFYSTILGCTIYILTGLFSRILMDDALSNTIVAYLLCATPLLFVTSKNTYTREILYAYGYEKFIRNVGVIAVFNYSSVNLAITTIIYFVDYGYLTPLLLLIGAYSTGFVNYILLTNKLNAIIPPLVKNISKKETIVVFGLMSAFTNAMNDVLDIGFLALVGWVLLVISPEIGALFYIAYSIVEWVAGLAIGASRKIMQLAAEGHNFRTSSLSIKGILSVYSLYAIVASIIIYVALQITTQFESNHPMLLVLLASYTIIDGCQLILRSFLLGKNRGRFVRAVAVVSYTIAILVLFIGAYLEIGLLILCSLFLPIATAMIVHFKKVQNYAI